jgi:OOP family OmpA-OmpF porin
MITALPFRSLPWLLLVLLVMSNCTRIETLQRVTPTGSPFQIALTKKYTKFAEEEAKQCAWSSSQHFIDKGMKTAYGQTALPEDLTEWNIPENELPQLQQARMSLIEVLTQHPEIINAHPETAAEAQFSFDCWVKQQQGNWRVDEIEECRDGFYAAINSLTGGKMGQNIKPPKAPSKPIAKPEASTAAPDQAAKDQAFNYRIFFDSNHADVTPKMQKVIDHILADVKNLHNYEYVLNGYADRAGSEDFNLALSKRRAIAVRNRLVAGGMRESAITIFAYGESDNAIATEDGVSEPANRRVEIVLSD